jgi:uncharacterized phage protein (TIGR02220 family)
MSFMATAWAVKQKTGSPTRKLVLLLLADRANDKGVCWPSMQTIAEDCELSDRAVRNNIRQLEEIGLLTTERRKDGDTQLSNMYHLPVGTVLVSSEHDGTGVRNEVPRGSDVPRGTEGDSEGARNEIPPNLSDEPIKESDKEIRYKELLDGFNLITGRALRSIGPKAKRQLNALIKDGYSVGDVLRAIDYCNSNEWFRNPAHRKYLTPEYITRMDKFQVYFAEVSDQDKAAENGGHHSPSV